MMRAACMTALCALFAAGGVASAEPDSGDARDFERLLGALDAKEKRLEQEIERIGPELALVDKRTRARGRAYYRLVRAGLLPVGGGFAALVDHAANVERLRAALTRDLRLSEELSSRRKAAEIELRHVRAERAPLTIQREAMQRAQSAMQQAEERRAAFLRAFGRGSGDYAPHMAVYGANAPATVGPLGRFVDMKGRLSFPLSGRAEVIQPIAPSTEPQGVHLVASRDTAVRAVYPGRVVFAGPTHRGETVVLDHGDNYFTVYGQLSHVEVKMGEELGERARVGWVLRYNDKSPTLYFEVRHGKRLLDAARWLGL
jgi:septal ring factor EnvC (AmiA/AmiB activator)